MAINNNYKLPFGQAKCIHTSLHARCGCSPTAKYTPFLLVHGEKVGTRLRPSLGHRASRGSPILM